jgi:hypothetical protein
MAKVANPNKKMATPLIVDYMNDVHQRMFGPCFEG